MKSMTRVYVLTVGEYEDEFPYGVFTTLQKAMAQVPDKWKLEPGELPRCYTKDHIATVYIMNLDDSSLDSHHPYYAPELDGV